MATGEREKNFFSFFFLFFFFFLQVYVGSADSSEHDQLLDRVLVGPVEVRLGLFSLFGKGGAEMISKKKK
jgi:hypothetical protein